ncbi:hypothetical protein DdX_07593 [Ditylenchus destructor]|uniref:Uncharacterized protein n=1 Tax=Ditylenchus destructor TaxID=166010 RepID=A0AAD4N6Q1_9BILA|nr:hypothetical protein DdX_07593 [Ditylenchus destructor]
MTPSPKKNPTLYPDLNDEDDSSASTSRDSESPTEPEPLNVTKRKTVSRSVTKNEHRLGFEHLQESSRTTRNRSTSRKRKSDPPPRKSNFGDDFEELRDRIGAMFNNYIGNSLSDWWAERESYQKIGIVSIVVLLMIIATLFLWNSFRTSNKDVMDRFLADSETITNEHFSGNKKVSGIFRYTGRILLSQTSTTPVTILLIGRENETERFLTYFKRLIKRYLQDPILDYSVPANEPPSRRELETTLFDHLKKNRLVILRRIDNLQSTAPLVLQSVTDPESSPFKNSVIIATITPQPSEERKSGINNCNDRMVSHLLDRWRHGLTADKVSLILTIFLIFVLYFRFIR